TTDTANPPQFVKALLLPANQGRDMGYPAASFAEQQRAGYPDLGPFKLAMPPDEAFKRVEVTAERMPDWEIIRDDASARALEGVSSTRLFRFHDDFVIEVRPLDDGSVVQMRSKSRDGKGDVGANAARIKAFFEKLKEAPRPPKTRAHMSPVAQAVLASWTIPPGLLGVLLLVGIIYARGFRQVHPQMPERFPWWRLGSFVAGLAVLVFA